MTALLLYCLLHYKVVGGLHCALVLQCVVVCWIERCGVDGEEEGVSYWNGGWWMIEVVWLMLS